MLGGLSSASNGLPFLNDAVFFLGNTYFSEVNRAVRTVNSDFFRFADDYRLFGPSISVLEKPLAALRPRLKEIGFEINETKLRLGSGTEYLQAISRLQNGATAKTEYIDTAVQPDVFRAEDLHAQVVQVLRAPEEYLHQGFGRLQMSAIRRMRVRALFSDEQGYADSPADQFATILSKDVETIDRVCELLEAYVQDPLSPWRLIWIVYLSKSIKVGAVPNSASRARLQAALERVERSQNLPTVVRLWSSRMPEFPRLQRLSGQVEELQSLGYLAEGVACYGP